MSTKRSSAPRHEPTRTEPRQTDLPEGWRAVSRWLETEIPYFDADAVAAAHREDRPRRYRRKHSRGVSS